MRVLLLSGYDAGSHRVWRQQLRQLDHDWVELSLEPRHFAWRMRGNALWWALGPDRQVLEGDFDLIIATSMVDVATLRGLLPGLSNTPVITYWHENQFAYPVQNDADANLLHFQLTNLYTALASEVCVFNSQFNMDTMLAGVEALLARMPDHVPAGTIQVLKSKSRVVPVPLSDTLFGRDRNTGGPLRVLWNHRWEYDKNPGVFFSAIRLARQQGANLRVSIVGQRFRKVPAEFEIARRELEEIIDVWGFQPSRSDYESCVSQCDVVVSTALHEFQGVAVQEAIALGCIPLVPDRLAYPEYVPAEYRYESRVDDSNREAETLAERLVLWSQEEERLRQAVRVDVSHLAWSHVKHQYISLIDGISG